MGKSTFQITESRYIPAVRSHVTVSKDSGSGAVLVHLLCEEERENFFAACFRTVPEDDTGLPHIIEHTVLNGSAKYPVKDPFMEMVKSSMATFINALTYGDRTVYPCGSLNTQDFQNLISVYMDSVFNPLLKEDFFRQEGYRLDCGSDKKLVHNGVVYNEMKGAYSDQDSYIEREVSRILYPDGSCGKDSGGDPPAITDLAYSRFREFYLDHYTPGNCCLFALTRIPFEEFSEFIGEMIPERQSFPVEPVNQKAFSEPVKREVPVPEDGGGCTVVCAWKVNGPGDPVETLAFSLLEDILLEDDSSPVRKILLDSDLGAGLASCGYDADPHERNFIIGLKGVEKARSDELLALIRSTLKQLVHSGLAEDLVQSMLHRKELHLKYAGSGWPMALMNAVTAAWTHKESIMQTLDLNGILDELKKRMAENHRFLEEMIQFWLIDNPHRADIVFYPDGTLFMEEERKTELELDELKNSMSTEKLESIRRNSESLQEKMNTPNTPEELATLPKLHLSEIPFTAQTLYHTETDTGKGILLDTRMHSSEVCYVDLVLDLSDLPDSLAPHTSFYTDLVTRTGAGEKDYMQMAQEELACSGGINASVKCGTHTVNTVDGYRLVMKIAGYCLKRDLPAMLDVMEKRLLVPDVSCEKRIASVAGEMAEYERSSLIPRGHTIAMLAARAGLSKAHHTSNLLGGLPSLKLLSSVNRKNAGKHSEILEGIRKRIASGVPGVMAWTGPEEVKETVTKWLENLPVLSPGNTTVPSLRESVPMETGIRTGPGTCFAAGALHGIPLNHPLSAPGAVMLRMLSEGFLWDRIRVQRGAYGAGVGLSGGAVTFYSYRDPSPEASLLVFREAAENGYAHLDSSRRSVEDSIIASLKNINPPARPAMANGMALMRHLQEITEKKAENFRQNLLEVTSDSMRDFSEWLRASSDGMRISVMGSRECIKKASIKNIVSLQEGK